MWLIVSLPCVVLQVLRSCLRKCEWCLRRWACVWVLPSATCPCLSLLTSWGTGSSCSSAYPCPAWCMSPFGGKSSSPPVHTFCPCGFFGSTDTEEGNVTADWESRLRNLDCNIINNGADFSLPVRFVSLQTLQADTRISALAPFPGKSQRGWGHRHQGCQDEPSWGS